MVFNQTYAAPLTIRTRDMLLRRSRTGLASKMANTTQHNATVLPQRMYIGVSVRTVHCV
jgi:hypothetical protein